MLDKAVEVWNLKKDFKETSRVIWGKMLRSRKIEEISLTAEVIDRLKELNSERLLAIKRVNDKKNGADIE